MLAIANFHYIREDFAAKHPSIFGITPNQFKNQLQELSKHGSFISQEELLQFKEKPFDKNYILITFDDGLKEQYKLAKPILDEMGISFIFFINTSNFREKTVSLVHKIHLLRAEIPSVELLNVLGEETSFLTSEEISRAVLHYNYDDPETAKLKYILNFKLSISEQQQCIDPLFQKNFDEKIVASALYFDDEMLKNLHWENNLGSHSHHHLPLAKLTSEELKKELVATQGFFQQKFNKKAISMSYPYGSFEACCGISKTIKEAGFEFGFTMERAVNENIRENPLLLSRFDCNDLPGGKANLFKTKPIFENPTLRKWHNNESGFIHK